MPLSVTIIWCLFHLIIAIGINWVLTQLNLIHYGEALTVYFIILSARYYDTQAKFALAYKQDPELIEALMRDQLNID